MPEPSNSHTLSCCELLLLLCCRCVQFFELWCHPKLYRTQMCRDGAACSRVVCFFAHNVQQLRLPSERLPPLSGEAADLLAAQARDPAAAAAAESAADTANAAASAVISSAAGAAAAAPGAEGYIGQYNSSNSSSSNQASTSTLLGPQIVPWMRAPQQANVSLPNPGPDDASYSGSMALYAHDQQQQQQQYVMVPQQQQQQQYVMMQQQYAMVPHVSSHAFPVSLEAATDDPCNRSTQLQNSSTQLFNVTSSGMFAVSSELLAAQCTSSSTITAPSSYMAASNHTSFAASSSSGRLQQALSPQAGNASCSRHIGSFGGGRSMPSRYSSSSLATLYEVQQNIAAQQQQPQHAGLMQLASMINAEQSISPKLAQGYSGMPASFSAGSNISAAAWRAAAAAGEPQHMTAAAAAETCSDAAAAAAAAAAQLSLGTAVSHLAAAAAAVGATAEMPASSSRATAAFAVAAQLSPVAFSEPSMQMLEELSREQAMSPTEDAAWVNGGWQYPNNSDLAACHAVHGVFTEHAASRPRVLILEQQ
jgi:hypothetical protein